MTQVSKVFQVSIYTLASIASLMLAFAEGASFPQAFTLPLAVLAFFFTERGKIFALPAWCANLMGLSAFAMAGWEFFSKDIEGRILSGAHLLVYLSWIVLFQEKRVVQYWWMCALGILQVAVGSVLTNDESYGGMLIGYMVFSIWTLSVFSLHQAQLQFGVATGREGADAAANRKEREKGRLQDARLRTKPETSLAAFLARPSVGRGAIQHDPNERWLGPQFLFTNLGTVVLALTISACFFLLIPRLWAGRPDWETDHTNLRREISGFSTQVKLGDFGNVLASTEKVFEIRVFDNDTNRELDVETYADSIGLSEPLFRGTILAEYDNGTWTGVQRDSAVVLELPNDVSEKMIRQEIYLQPIVKDILFAMHPIQSGRLNTRPDEMEIQAGTGVLFRPSRIPPERPLGYSIYSPSPEETRSLDGVMMRHRGRRPNAPRQMAQLNQEYYTPPGPRLAKLTELARRVAGYETSTKPSPRIMADRIHSYLRNSKEFSYSLDTSIQDDTIDPIEDFLFNRKKGHCKYFATALALMLRAVDIPTRLVSGFKGGVTNAISGHFEVEQRHAHAWVEASIDGGWRTFDATPEAREESVQSFAPTIQTAHDLASFVKGTWSRYVVNMDISQQNSNFYDPLLQWFRSWRDASIVGKSRITEYWSDLLTFLMDPSRWFSFWGAGLTFVLLLLAAGFARLARRSPWLWNLISRLWRRKHDTRRLRIAFYERFENLCASLSLVRERSQTQQEFGHVVRRRLEGLASNGQLGGIPALVVQSFYQVRFGEQELDSTQAEHLSRQLTQLEETIAATHGRK